MAAGVFFLDFDGPYFPKKILILQENRYEKAREMCNKLNLYPNIDYWKMDAVAVAMTNNIYNDYYPFEAVISSSWSHPLLHDKKQIQGLMDINGFDCPMHKDWRTSKDSDKRVEQIAEWLKLHPEVTKYIILDDMESGKEMADKNILESFGINPEFVFIVDVNNGITLADYHNISRIVGKW